jgi:hypothetical protein
LKKLIIMAALLAASLAGCSAGVGFAIPVGPVSLGVGVGPGGVSAGVGTGVGPVGVGVGVDQGGRVGAGVGVGAGVPVGNGRVGVGVGTGTVLYDPQRARPSQVLPQRAGAAPASAADQVVP